MASPRSGFSTRTTWGSGGSEPPHARQAHTAINSNVTGPGMALLMKGVYRDGDRCCKRVWSHESGGRWLLEFAPTREPEIIEMTVSTDFDLDPVG